MKKLSLVWNLGNRRWRINDSIKVLTTDLKQYVVRKSNISLLYPTTGYFKRVYFLLDLFTPAQRLKFSFNTDIWGCGLLKGPMSPMRISKNARSLFHISVKRKNVKDKIFTRKYYLKVRRNYAWIRFSSTSSPSYTIFIRCSRFRALGQQVHALRIRELIAG